MQKPCFSSRLKPVLNNSLARSFVWPIPSGFSDARDGLLLKKPLQHQTAAAQAPHRPLTVSLELSKRKPCLA
ncbi:MAG: hypothetical protein EBT85_06675, partial [Synechococcaceae bacterium WB5_2B_268]|nr:hypothetical protein [Synechococcaceae bacterium WB5_2B_268]